MFLSATPAYWRVQELQKLPKPPLSRCVCVGRLLLAGVFKRYSRHEFWRFTVHSTVEKTKPRLCLKLCFLRLFDLFLCSWQPFPNLFFRDSWGWGGMEVEVGSGGCFPNFCSLQRSPSGAVRNDCPLFMVWSGAREPPLFS